jgi:hypothetical protein
MHEATNNAMNPDIFVVLADVARGRQALASRSPRSRW